ncbi:uncharacterized protein MONOS_12189 [Monocercomonoides exilis]|uniref:uncharacterized protein n=1 Tax=Monocercomonoides exilis TaxID=2049356 RepID=UPI0035598CFC|nr:hypothetical protein MONOS_12189 [Monocercomonoides exilis]|eukprot:MONOS_12189.1-p1 / transcript=MONOS_12189.1 / gene=MONOS_12189 / organism=Monocercomonoides_exilis_PA203 / gene_product=unspecified product / transcript_product=unspecified product / location=Mono_scaffold00657:31759-32361(-) / protein_length=201 / sequence_SO=supercontig / SO=protein_coding / is_pseudo=false
MDEFVAIGAIVLQESVPSIALWDATFEIGQVRHRKGMIEEFCVSYCVFAYEWESLLMCAVDLSVGPPAASSEFRWMSYLLQGGIEIVSGNYLLPRRAGTAALHARTPSSDPAHSASARPQASSSGAHRYTSLRHVVCVQRVSSQPASDPSGTCAQVCACLSPEATLSFVIVQPFYQPELSRVPHWQLSIFFWGHSIIAFG